MLNPTTIKVDKSTLRYLTSLKGYFEYQFGRKISFDWLIKFLCFIFDLKIMENEKKDDFDNPIWTQMLGKRLESFGMYDFDFGKEEENILEEFDSWRVVKTKIPLKTKK
jgi:hypothetical protein